MFGFLKKKKKPVITTEIPETQENGYFLNERDIKIIANACVFFAKSVRAGENGQIVDGIPEVGGKLREKSDLSPDNITVISVCLQAFNAEMSRLINENPESPVVLKLRDEKVYFLTIIEKLTNYLTAGLKAS
jgi:hypothetical protein